MTLRALLEQSNYKSIFNCLYKNYYYKDPEESVIEMSLAYRKVITEILNSTVSPTKEYKILITQEEGMEDGLESASVEIGLYYPEEEGFYAIDLTPWSDLADAEIQNDTNIENKCMAAHILWEITFYGFTEDALLSHRDEIKDQLQAIEGGEEKLTLWENIEQEIDELADD